MRKRTKIIVTIVSFFCLVTLVAISLFFYLTRDLKQPYVKLANRFLQKIGREGRIDKDAARFHIDVEMGETTILTDSLDVRFNKREKVIAYTNEAERDAMDEIIKQNKEKGIKRIPQLSRDKVCQIADEFAQKAMGKAFRKYGRTRVTFRGDGRHWVSYNRMYEGYHFEYDKLIISISDISASVWRYELTRLSPAPRINIKIMEEEAMEIAKEKMKDVFALWSKEDRYERYKNVSAGNAVDVKLMIVNPDTYYLDFVEPLEGEPLRSRLAYVVFLETYYFRDGKKLKVTGKRRFKRKIFRPSGEDVEIWGWQEPCSEIWVDAENGEILGGCPAH